MILNPKKIFGIFGYPIGHTRSPAMHNAAFEALQLPYQYLPFEVSPARLKEAVAAIIALGIGGVNITRPHKEAVIPFLHRLTKEAEATGAVNTIEVAGDQLVGHNTDGPGFLRSLSEAHVNPSGMRVILLGAGGAARGVAVALLSANISEMVILARSENQQLVGHLTTLAPTIKITSYPLRKNDFGDEPTLLINTTPLGMETNDPLPYPASLLHPTWVVADLIYSPFKTPLLQAAEKQGITIVPGIGMLLHQGVLAFEIFTKQAAPTEVMRKAISG